MARRLPAAREFRGFILSANGGACARWRAWRADGVKMRADTLAGIKESVREHIASE